MNTIILAVRANRYLIAGVAGMVVAFFLVVAVVLRGPAHHQPRSSFAPDPASVRYRYAVSTAREDQADTIAALEERLASVASPMYETAELAELYYQRAVSVDGDPRDYDASEAMAKRSLALVRRPNSALLTLAKLHNARHQFREAIVLAREHMSANPTSAGYLVLATAHLALGELFEASEAANAALAQQPDGNGYLMRALVLQAQGRDAEAAYDFVRAAAVEAHGDPDGAARLRALWGRFLISRGELAGAELVLDEALRIAPTHSLALAQSGELALRTGQHARAESLFEQAFASSRQVRYLIDQARAKDAAGDRAGADALRVQVEAIVRAERSPEGGGLGHRLDLVEVLVDRGNANGLAEAVKLARAEVADRPSALARFHHARALAAIGATADALAEIGKVLATGAREPRFYELASQLEARRGNAGRAALFASLARSPR